MCGDEGLGRALGGDPGHAGPRPCRALEVRSSNDDRHEYQDLRCHGVRRYRALTSRLFDLFGHADATSPSRCCSSMIRAGLGDRVPQCRLADGSTRSRTGKVCPVTNRVTRSTGASGCSPIGRLSSPTRTIRRCCLTTHPSQGVLRRTGGVTPPPSDAKVIGQTRTLLIRAGRCVPGTPPSFGHEGRCPSFYVEVRWSAAHGWWAGRGRRGVRG